MKTKMNNRLKSVLCLVVALVCLVCSFAPVSVYADVVGDLEDQRNELDEEIKENEENRPAKIAEYIALSIAFSSP